MTAYLGRLSKVTPTFIIPQVPDQYDVNINKHADLNIFSIIDKL